MLAFDKFIVAVVRGSPDSETVASLNDMRKLIEENFEKVFRPDRDQILYIRSKKKLELNKITLTIGVFTDKRAIKVVSNIFKLNLILIVCS